MIRQMMCEEVPVVVELISESFMTVADAFGLTVENAVLRKWYEQNGAVHIGTEKYDFFPFTCGYMKREL